MNARALLVVVLGLLGTGMAACPASASELTAGRYRVQSGTAELRPPATGAGRYSVQGGRTSVSKAAIGDARYSVRIAGHLVSTVAADCDASPGNLVYADGFEQVMLAVQRTGQPRQ